MQRAKAFLDLGKLIILVYASVSNTYIHLKLILSLDKYLYNYRESQERKRDIYKAIFNISSSFCRD